MLTSDELIAALAPTYGAGVVEGLVKDFVQIRRDHATSTLERASPGKFIEGFVQALQFMDDGTFEAKPNVEHFLNSVVENRMGLPDGLRIIAPRIARSVYALRSKRSIAHKNEIDPNEADLAQIHASASWIMSEMLRYASGVSMARAAELIAQVQAPVGPLVEEIDDTVLVHADLPVRSEILVLLHRQYPEYVPNSSLVRSIGAKGRRSISGRLSELRRTKFVFGDSEKGHRLTQAGFREASKIIASALIE